MNQHDPAIKLTTFCDELYAVTRLGKLLRMLPALGWRVEFTIEGDSIIDAHSHRGELYLVTEAGNVHQGKFVSPRMDGWSPHVVFQSLGEVVAD